MEKAIESVMEKVLAKLEGYMETVEPEKLSPQALKQVTATLKDIRELQTETQTDSQIRVIFSAPEWNQ